MTWNPIATLSLCLLCLNGISQELAQISKTTQPTNRDNSCSRSIFVESPVADTYVATEDDTVSFGYEPILKVRGVPERKSMSALLSYEVHHLDPNYLDKAYLKIYTASKDRGDHISLYSVQQPIRENGTNWRNQPKDQLKLGDQPVTDAPFITFEITDYVKGHLKDGYLNFNLQSDSKKVIDIASRESGLSAELIMSMCTFNDQGFTPAKKQESFLKVLPSTLEGKLTIQLVKVPAGGFGELMFMTDQGDILFQIPLSIQDAELSYHTIDFKNLIPGVYWAVLRKGRALIKDQFRLKPVSGSTFLSVDSEFTPENRP